MRAQINIKLCRDPATGHDYRAVYLGREHVASFWHLPAAFDCAKPLAELSGAKIHSAEVVPFRKAVAS